MDATDQDLERSQEILERLTGQLADLFPHRAEACFGRAALAVRRLAFRGRAGQRRLVRGPRCGRELGREAAGVERWNLLHPEDAPRTAFVTQCLGGSSAPVVAATDYIRRIDDTIAALATAAWAWVHSPRVR